MKIQLGNLVQTIQTNCHISDARHAGLFSLCGLLLRLRDLFKWERGMDPWEEPEPAELMEWVDRREDLWETLLDDDLQGIQVGEREHDPFDVHGITTVLRPIGLVYGAGYALGMKPSFFLGKLAESREIGKLRVDIIDMELARDIFASPVMRQGDCIVARRTIMLFVLWDLILEMRASARDALSFALDQYGLDAETMRRLSRSHGPELVRVAAVEMETWIHHEVGEYYESSFPGEVWHEIVAAYSGTPIEIYARVVKDLLADTHPQGLLGYIIEHRVKSSLGFYIANARAFMRLLFPEILDAFTRFREREDWGAIEEAREIGQNNGRIRAEKLVDIHLDGHGGGGSDARERIMSEIIEPLGILRGSMIDNRDDGA